MEHIYSYSPELQSKKPTNNFRVYLGLFMLTFGVVLSISAGVIRLQRSRVSQIDSPTKNLLADNHNNETNERTNLAPLLAKNDLGSPVNQAVAGTDDEKNQTSSGFTNLTKDAKQSQCQPVVFMIGEPEKNQFSHLSDELNWVGALDVLPKAVDPFIVGQNQSSDFPWRTSQDGPGDVVNHVQFEYKGPKTTGELILSWSPGKSGSASKLIYLDKKLIKSTPNYQGKFVEQRWQNMPLVSDRVKVTLDPGVHILTIKSVSGGGDPSVWDYIQLTATCP